MWGSHSLAWFCMILDRLVVIVFVVGAVDVDPCL